MDTAKIFWSGRSQAVRLPKEFRFDAAEVLIKRRGSTVILEPIPETWDWLASLVGTVDADFEAATDEMLPAQQRPDLDVFE